MPGKSRENKKGFIHRKVLDAKKSSVLAKYLEGSKCTPP